MKLDSAVLYSNNIEKAIKFYQDIIGLKLEYRQENKYASLLFTNDVRLGIKKKSDEREIPGVQALLIDAENIEQVWEKMKKKGVSIYKDLAEKSWGKEFSILDPDKNKVVFIQRK